MDLLVECVLAGMLPADVLSLFEAYSETDSYYRVKDHFPIKLVIKRWTDLGQKVYDDSMPVMYKPNEIWKYREYDWTRETARSGFAKVDGKSVDLPGPLKWDALVADMKERGWDQKDPLILKIGHKRAMVGEGNHRLAIARATKIQVPVDYWFISGNIGLPARSKKRQDDEKEMDRQLKLAKEKTIKQAIKKAPSKPMDKETEKMVSDIMDLLGF